MLDSPSRRWCCPKASSSSASGHRSSIILRISGAVASFSATISSETSDALADSTVTSSPARRYFGGCQGDATSALWIACRPE
jgi:hypothetical protein